MPKMHRFGWGRVNLIKKVKVDRVWKFCPAVVQPGRRLNDLVRVQGQIETHPEGTYYLEWREQGRRRRQPVRHRAIVFEQARLKALELESQSRSTEEPSAPPDPPPARLSPSPSLAAASFPAPLDAHQLPASPAIPEIERPAAHLVWPGLESYLQEMIGAVVRSQLAGFGLVAPVETRAAQQAVVNPGPAASEKPISPAPQAEGTPIAQAIESYLKDIEPPQREPKTYDEYRLVLYKFRDGCRKRRIEEINRDDLLEFRRQLYALGNEARTVFNRMGIVLQLLKLHGIERVLKKGDKPKFVRNVREMYQPEDLEALFEACTADEKVLYLFFLLTGERDKEVRHTTWADIDRSRSCVRVTAKKQLGFKPKDKEEREIPVPSSLLEALREYKARQSGPNPHNLVFPTASGKPDRKFENKLKRIANRAGLNCGHCVSRHGNQCSDGPHCGQWFLHKFRHTYATTSLENGVSIRTVQEWLGHSDLESTMIYLKYVRRKDIQQLVDTSELAALAAHAGQSRAGDPATKGVTTSRFRKVIAFEKYVPPVRV